VALYSSDQGEPEIDSSPDWQIEDDTRFFATYWGSPYREISWRETGNQKKIYRLEALGLLTAHRSDGSVSGQLTDLGRALLKLQPPR
jgi:hypothetical protein